MPHTPPIMANGTLSFALDAEGHQRQHPEYENLILSPRIWRYGRRSDRKDDSLLSLGHIELNLELDGQPIRPDKATMNQNTVQALLNTTAGYPPQIQIKGISFLHHSLPLAVFRRTISNLGDQLAHITATFSYVFDGPQQPSFIPPQDMTLQGIRTGVSCGYIDYSAHSSVPADGCIAIKTTATNVKPLSRNNTLDFTFSLPLPPGANKTLTFYIIFQDEMDAQDYHARILQLKNGLRRNSYRELLAEHRSHWAKIWKKVDLILPDPQLTTIYRTALYHLISLATDRQPFPDGPGNDYARGRINGLHELFIADALLHAGFTRQAMAPAMFRQKTMAKSLLNQDNALPIASFPVWAQEDGTAAGKTPPWPPTVSQNAHIALAAWHCAELSQDRQFLQETAYPLLRSAAQFFVTTMTCPGPGDFLAVVPCRDFPDSGSPQPQPLATTYAIIATLDAAVQASLILSLDEAPRNIWASQARKLKQTVPTDGQRLLLNPQRRSLGLGLMSGVYPYQLTDLKDSLQKHALAELFQHADELPTPEGTYAPSPWTYAWLAATAAILRLPVLAEDALQKSAHMAGEWGELPQFQTPEPETNPHPWFAPAQATFVRAITLMLLQSHGQTIHILPAIPPDWTELDVTLPAIGGLEVKIKLRDRTITRISLFNRTTCSTRRLITIPEDLRLPHPLEATKSYCIPANSSLRII